MPLSVLLLVGLLACGGSAETTPEAPAPPAKADTVGRSATAAPAVPGAGPWARVGTDFVEGGSYSGTVTKLVDYGAFVAIAPGVEGLVHISELAERRVDHPRSVVKRGQQVTVRILEIDREQNRIGLSMKEGDVPPLVLVWTGIAELHKSFFRTSELVTRLAVELQAQVVPPASVHIRFDNGWHKGWLQLQLRPGTLRRPIGGEATLIPLQELAPITTALATYRSSVAGRYDMRVESFHVGIESDRGPVRCVFGVGGLPPPDGRTVSSCVEINSQEHCGTEEPGGVRFSPEIAEKIRACLS